MNNSVMEWLIYWWALSMFSLIGIAITVGLHLLAVESGTAPEFPWGETK